MRVRVVDDAAPVAIGLCQALTSAGVEAKATTTGYDALLDPRAWEGVDGALVDYILDGITGARILMWLRDNRPEVRRVLLTGWPDIAVDAQDVAHVTLTKPSSVPEILDALGVH